MSWTKRLKRGMQEITDNVQEEEKFFRDTNLNFDRIFQAIEKQNDNLQKLIQVTRSFGIAASSGSSENKISIEQNTGHELVKIGIIKLIEQGIINRLCDVLHTNSNKTAQGDGTGTDPTTTYNNSSQRLDTINFRGILKKQKWRLHYKTGADGTYVKARVYFGSPAQYALPGGPGLAYYLKLGAYSKSWDFFHNAQDEVVYMWPLYDSDIISLTRYVEIANSGAVGTYGYITDEQEYVLWVKNDTFDRAYVSYKQQTKEFLESF